MVKVAIAGGSGRKYPAPSPVPFCTTEHLKLTAKSVDIASEIVDVLVATQRHEILILSRKVRDLIALRFSTTSMADPTLGPFCC